MDVSPEDLKELRDILDKLKVSSAALPKGARGGGVPGQNTGYDELARQTRTNPNSRRILFQELHDLMQELPESVYHGTKLKNLMRGKAPRRKG